MRGGPQRGPQRSPGAPGPRWWARWWPASWRRLASWRRPLGLDADLDAEIAAHLDLAASDLEAAGLSAAAARRAAQRGFGNALAVRERARAAWGLPAVESWLRDVRHGWRALRRAPGLSLAVVLTLALGIGANAAIFGVVYGVLLRPLPFPAAARLVRLEEASGRSSGFSVSWANFQAWRRASRSFADMAAYDRVHLTLTGRGEPALLRAARVTGSFYSLTGRRPAIGRLLGAADDRAGAAPAVLLEDRFWRQQLGGDRRVVGTSLVLDGKPYEIAGVAAPGASLFEPPPDLYLALGRVEDPGQPRSAHASLRGLARLAPGVTAAAAAADLDRVMRQLAAADPGPEADHRAAVTPWREARTGQVRAPLLAMMAAVVLVLGIACANVASLLLARGTARQREIAVRSALGGGRLRLVRQLLIESLLLAVLGGAAGLLLAAAGQRALAAIAPPQLAAYTAAASLGGPVLGFAAALTLAAGLVVGFAGLVPALRVAAGDLAPALAGGARSLSASPRQQRLRSGLVVAEVAVTLVLVFVSTLLLQSLAAALGAPPGFAPQRLLALELLLPAERYATADGQRAFYVRLTDDLRQLPGVAGVAAVSCPPSAGDCGDGFYSIAGEPPPAPGEVPIALFNVADPAYFQVLGIPLPAGRAFAATDGPHAPPVAVVNQAFARLHWPGQSALGRRIKYGGPYRSGAVYEIVGVAGNVSQMGLDENPLPEIFLPLAQQPQRAAVLMIRTAGDPAALIPAVRHRVTAVDSGLAIQGLRPLADSIAATLARRRFGTLLLAAFAVLAICLAAVGVHGLLSYWVGIRRREIAIRLAVGARRATILAWTAGHALRLVACGIAAGAVAAWLAGRWLESLVFGVPARAPAPFVIAIAILAAVGGLAAAVPALGAARVQPVRNL